MVPPRHHLLTVSVEDYYHVGAFNRLIQNRQWYRFERRVEIGTHRTLALLDAFGLKATFFVLGWVAEQLPELVREIAAHGHEIASKGFYHRNIRQMTPAEFREDLARAREALERASGRRVLGYRVADLWFTPPDLWALDLLAEEGYAYDSSVGPLLRAYAAEPWRRFAHRHRSGDRDLWEFPISAVSLFGLHLPIAGGNYFRQIPQGIMRRAVARWDRTCDAPYVMYFHTWELDPDQPKINAAPLHARIRHYRNLRDMPRILEYYFERYPFASIAEYLQLDTTGTGIAASAPTPRPAPAIAVTDPPVPDVRRADRIPISIAVPCYNEELILPYLSNTLRSVEAALSREYDVHFIFVDDSSTDGTWDALNELFGSRPNCTLVRHPQNMGVAAGILTAIRSARTEIVCSIDCDCTYDPHELARMIPLLDDGVDLVTASPYHPKGAVRNVPRWRLAMSRSLSRLYRRVLHQKLWTYTSCFRVYRRAAFLGLELERRGFLGVAEMLGRLDLAGAGIVEYPTTLDVRMLGRSKMKVLRTIVGHLTLLATLLRVRLSARARGERAAVPRESSEVAS
ncbi:MAG TPA: XrtA system polysaccharide deacetylase [Longimicrobiales bacterium]